jgi:hypothetical protein
MPFQGWPDGLYMVVQHSAQKGVDHYGILDVGNNLSYSAAPEPVIVHQSPPGVRAELLSSTGPWRVIGQIVDYAGARARLQAALANPRYDLLGNNCEHFARYVATGRRESRQLQSTLLVAGSIALIIAATQDRAA